MSRPPTAPGDVSSGRETDRIVISSGDLRAARSCLTKLYYRRAGYPVRNEGEAHAGSGELAHLRAMLQARFPAGKWVASRDADAAAAHTASALSREGAVVFHATFRHEDLVFHADVVQRTREGLTIYVLVGKPWDPKVSLVTQAGGLRAEWQPAIRDLAFGQAVIAAAFPQLSVRVVLVVPDRTAVVQIDGLPGLCDAVIPVGQLDSPAKADAELLRKNTCLADLDVGLVIAEVADSVAADLARVRAALQPPLRRAQGTPRYACRDCEYRVEPGASPSGFSECWGELGAVSPHLFDLYMPNTVHDEQGRPIADQLIAERRVRLTDIPLDTLRTANGPRQKVQIACARSRQEWRSEQLTSILERLPYPLHFIDFETCTPLLPHHAGMRPSEIVAFQWSCHTLDQPGGELRHSEWLNDEPSYPNERFVRSLRECVGDSGTLLTWTGHEGTTLKQVAAQLQARHADTELVGWCLHAAVEQGRIFDLNAHCLAHYCHPAMGGSTSLKVVLPALWKARDDLRRESWFAAYDRSADGVAVGPYSLLPAVSVGGQMLRVADGTAAMAAYARLLSAQTIAADDAANLRSALLRYCCLDTLAMVFVWRTWINASAARR